MYLRSIIASAAVLLVAVPAQAVIVSQTLAFNSAIPGNNTQNLQLFNTPGFTLNSVLLTWTPILNGTVTVVSSSGNNRTAQSTFSVTSLLSSSTGAFTTFNNTVAAPTATYTLTGRSTTVVNLSGTTTASQSPTSLAAFTGSGTIPILLTIQNLVSNTVITSGGAGNFTATPSGTVSGNLTVDYDISSIPPFPEPATWVGMVLGFGLVGARLRARRAVPA